MIRNIDEKMLIKSKGSVICFRRIPQVRKSKDEYKGCRIYLNIPVSTSRDVSSNL